MKNNLKRVPTIFSFLLIIVISISSCSKKSATPSQNSTPQGTMVKWGEYISIPDLDGIYNSVEDLKTTNEGIYLKVNKGISQPHWIYRLQNGGPSPSWILHKKTESQTRSSELIYLWEPISMTNEKADEFGIFFMDTWNNGTISINSGTPSLSEQVNPPGFAYSVDKILIDNSPYRNKWAFFRDAKVVKIQSKNISEPNLYNQICALPSNKIDVVEADPNDAQVWLAVGTKLYKITASGELTPFDISSYMSSSSTMNKFISKIRFSYDVLHKDVYFRCENKVFKIENGNTLSLFYTIGNYGVDFAIDNKYMYAGDGIKKDLALLTETNIFSSVPTSIDPEIESKKSSFGSGQMEVSKDPLDGYIYILDVISKKILKVPKSL